MFSNPFFKINVDSKRHHYIPQFFVKAFTNKEGFLWIYDKKENKILRYPKHPRNIFFENYSNSIEINGEKVPLIELMYNGVNKRKGPDQLFSTPVKELQYSIDDETSMTMERVGYLIYFIAQLTWRIPANEIVNKILLDHLSHKDPMLYASMSKYSWLSKEDQFKIARFITPSLILREAYKVLIPGKLQVKIIDCHDTALCLSDNPVIWKAFPSGISDFTTPLIFPINKQKMFLILEQNEYNYSTEDLKSTILILMYQAKRYVGFHDRERLQNYVDAYQEFRKIGGLGYRVAIKKLFERITNKASASI